MYWVDTMMVTKTLSLVLVSTATSRAWTRVESAPATSWQTHGITQWQPGSANFWNFPRCWITWMVPWGTHVQQTQQDISTVVEIASDCGEGREGSDGQARVRWEVTFRPKIADVSILLKTGRVLSRRALGGRTCVGGWCAGTTLEGFRRFVCGYSRGVPREVASTCSQLDDKTNRGHFDDESCSAMWVPNRVNSTPGEFWKSFFVSQAGRYDGGGDARRPVLR